MKNLMLTLSFMLCMMLNSYAASPPSSIYYVNAAATGANNGGSWADAYTDLQSALTSATNSGDQIWIAKGIYRPSLDITGNASPTDPRTKTFYVNKNISIYGGFDGTENTLADRTLALINPITADATDATILSGDLADNEDDINSSGTTYTAGAIAGADNAYTVVHIGSGVSSAALISGCIITAGSATDSSPTLPQDVAGAGIFNTGTGVIIQATYLAGNLAASQGAGLYTSKNITLANSVILGCVANEGGAIYNNSSDLTLSATYFAFNSTNGDGGVIYNMAATSAINVTSINCSFFNCSSNGSNGGMMYNNGTLNPITNIMINCTVIKNTANSGIGGVLYNDGTVVNSIYNSIFNENLAGTANLFHNDDAVTTNVTLEYSLMQGANATAESTGPGTITTNSGMIYNQNPDLVNTGPTDTDLTLKTSSPCINAGNNTILNASGITTDLQNAPRFYCNMVDMGALERSNGKGSLVRNQVIQLNGTNQYVDIQDTISSEFVGKSFTIETWIKVTAYDAAATTETILTNRNGNTGINFCIVGQQDAVNQGKLALRIGTSETAYGTSTLPVGEWTHVAVTFNHTGTSNMNVVDFYINGKLDANFTMADDVAATTANTFIGYESSTSDAINAELEEFRIWSDVRTIEELQMNKRLLLPCGATDILATYEFNNDAANALELTAAPAGAYSGTAMGGATYTTSTIPLSLGNSSKFTISGAGANTHTGTDGSSLETTFAAANHPNGDIVVSYLGENHSGNAINSLIAGTSGQYVIDNYGTVTTGLDYDLKFNVSDAANINMAVTEYSLEKRESNAAGDWVVVATEATAVSNTGGSKHLTFNIVGGSFSQFLPTQGNIIFVPVEMTYFTAVLEGEQVNLDWETASEEQNTGFFVQKSANGKNWETLDFVEGAGTTYEVQTYHFIDKKPINGINYYRLKQLDFDDNFEYSDIRTVNYGDKQNAIALYPNPVQNQLIIEIPNNETNVLVDIFDLTGRKIISQEIQASQTQANIDFSKLENGIYLLQINGNNWQKVDKIVVQH